jgi:hypothetical protein
MSCALSCPVFSPVTPSPACPTLCTTDTATTIDSMDGAPASVISVLLGFPVVSPQTLPRSCVPVVVPRCCDITLIFLEYEKVAMGRRSMNVDVAVMR